MENMQFIGIDISKKKLDWHIPMREERKHRVTQNTPESILALLQQAKKLGVEKDSTTICAEYTGHYIFPLVQACRKAGFRLWLIPGAEIKLSLGLQRGKNDQVDAGRIAEYGRRFPDRIRLYNTSAEALERLEALSTEKKMYKVQLAKYKGRITDTKGFVHQDYYQESCRRMSILMQELELLIQELEQEMGRIVSEDAKLARQYQIVTSVPFVSTQIAMATLIATRGFTKFKDPKKFACHVGVVPFEYNSGSSQRSVPKLSQKAKKPLKALYHMGALAAISKKGEWQDYYLKKTKEGKRAMTALNAIRRKMIHRIFALVRDDRVFDPEYQNPLAT